MQFGIGLQPWVPCDNEDHAPALLGAWATYAAAVLTEFGLQADANKVEYVACDAGNALGRFWVDHPQPLTQKVASALYSVAPNPMVSVHGACSELQYIALEALLLKSNVEGCKEVDWFADDVSVVLFPSDANELLEVTNILHRVFK